MRVEILQDAEDELNEAIVLPLFRFLLGPFSTTLPRMPVELQIEQMTLEEKLRAMEALWADLCRRDENVPVSQWHKELLDERERLVERGEARFLDWQTAQRRISERTA